MSNLSQFLTGAVVVVEYDDRATLRSLTPAVGALRAVTGLGLFRWASGATELDDDATCFATASGVWLLIAADPDYVFGAWVTRVDDLESKYLTGSFSMSLTSLAAISSSDFTVTIPGAAVGDSVIVNPGNSFGTSGADQGKLSYVAYVSATDTAIISIRNASASTANMTASTWGLLVIKQ